MKKTIYKILTLALAVVLIIGCSKLEDFGDTNLNPAATTTPNTAALLTQSLSTVGGFGAINTPALYCQFFSETQYTETSCYSTQMVSSAGNYSGILFDLQNIITTNEDPATKDAAALNGANDNQIAIARILKAYLYWNMTDRWGDIPYSEALKGNPNVAYDTQESIYKDLIKELKESVAQFTTGAAIKGDIIFGGDLAKWKKTANSMRLLMALRLSKVYTGSADYAATEFKAALAETSGVIVANADNFQVNYPGGSFKSPTWSRYDGRKDFGESLTMTTMLTSTLNNDPRQGVYGATDIGAASTNGVPYGWERNAATTWTNANANWTYVFHPDFRKETSPIFLITAAAVNLARAEAADKGWTTENMVDMYKAGIKASFNQWGLADPTAAYLSSGSVALGAAAGTGANLQNIAIQQWVAYYPDGCQGWANWRRTGYPALLPARDATNTPKVIPRRYMYATSDYALTKEGVEAAAARLTGGDKQDSKIWWDK
jgi:hypothetical protein